MIFRHENMVELEIFFPDIEPELPRCPTPVIENRIRDTIIDACERSNIWRWEMPEILLIKGVQEYDLPTPAADLLIHSILSLTLGRRAYDDYMVTDRGRIRLGEEPIADSSPQTIPITTIVGGTPQTINKINPNRDAKGITATVSIKPSRTTLEVSEVLYRDYYDLIIKGSLAKGLMMLNRPWTNVKMGKEYEKKYEYALAKAKQGLDRRLRTGSQRVKLRKFAL